MMDVIANIITGNMITNIIVAVVAGISIVSGIAICVGGINQKHKRNAELEKMKYQKEILELEIEKQNNEIKLLDSQIKLLEDMRKSKN